MEQEFINEILDEQEETLVQQFYENERMREAVKKVLLAPLYYQGVLKRGTKVRIRNNWALNYLGNTNENLGAVVRACSQGLEFVEKGFEWLSKIKKPEHIKVETKNQAR